MTGVMMLVVVVLFAVTGCHSGGGGRAVGEPSLFPTAGNIVTMATATTTVAMPDNTQVPAASGQVIAEFKDTAVRSDYDNLVSFLAQKGFSIIGQIPNLYMVQIGVVSDAQITPLISDLKSLSYIGDAYPNMATSPALNPNPYYPSNGAYWIDDIQARDAWNISIGNSNVIIGVVDTGINQDNPQFVKNKIVNLNTPHILGGHGIGVASVAVASGDDADVNSYGTTDNNMAGICWNCSVVAYDTTWGIGEIRIPFVFTINSGIEEAIAKKAKVVNISADSLFESVATQELFRWFLKSSVKLAHNSNVLLVFAAGNTPISDNQIFPTFLESFEYEAYWKSNVVVVTASKEDTPISYSIADFATIGNVVDIAAPGEQIGVATSNGLVNIEDGTSFSAPMVSGVAGLIWSVNPTLSAADVKAIITDPHNTTEAANDPRIRILNAYKAVSDPRVVGFNGIALGIFSSADGNGVNAMKFNQNGTDFIGGIMADPDPAVGYNAGTVGTGQMIGTNFNLTFDYDIAGNPISSVIKGHALSSNMLISDDISDSTSPSDKIEFYYSGIQENPAACYGMTPESIIYGFNYFTVTVNYTTDSVNHSPVTFMLFQTSNPNILEWRSDDLNYRGGIGWLSGDQLLLGFVDNSDSANSITAILQGTLSADCSTASGTWSSHAFGSTTEIATGTWQMSK